MKKSSLAMQSPSERRRRRGLLVLVSFLASAGCGGSGDEDRRSVPRTNIITGSTGSTWYTIGSGIAEKANEFFPGHPITAVPGAGGMSNPVRVSMTGMDMGISYGPFLRSAFRGEPPFREAYPRLRVIASLILNTLHVIASPPPELETMADLASLPGAVRMGSGVPGSGELFCLTALFEVLGTSLDEWQEQGHVLRLWGSGQRFDDWKDGRLEIVMAFINDPSPGLTELMLTRPGRFLPVPPEVRRALEERWGFRHVILEPNSYPNQDYAVETVALPSILFTVEDVREELVYAATRALYENRDYLESIHPGFKRWDPADLPEEVGVPFHPGALRYHREQGLLPPDLP